MAEELGRHRSQAGRRRGRGWRCSRHRSSRLRRSGSCQPSRRSWFRCSAERSPTDSRRRLSLDRPEPQRDQENRAHGVYRSPRHGARAPQIELSYRQRHWAALLLQWRELPRRRTRHAAVRPAGRMSPRWSGRTATNGRSCRTARFRPCSEFAFAARAPIAASVLSDHLALAR
jgi:hypothetical protein